MGGVSFLPANTHQANLLLGLDHTGFVQLALVRGVGVTLLRFVRGADDPWRILASSIYGATLIALFLASTLYHSMFASRHREIFKLLDHCAIYLLIAGTYTPFILVTMRTGTGWLLFGAIWALATAGILTKLWFRHRYPKLSMISYLVMGWLVVLAAPEVARAVGSSAMVWLVAGGLAYTIGAVFYAAKRLPFNHAIWHLFVVAGSVFHFMAVILYVLPSGEAIAVSG